MLPALLPETEVSPDGGQCSHARRTWLKLAGGDAAKLSGRM
jgi:hypothetical protein